VFWLGDLNYRVDFGEHGTEEEFNHVLGFFESDFSDIFPFFFSLFSLS